MTGVSLDADGPGSHHPQQDKHDAPKLSSLFQLNEVASLLPGYHITRRVVFPVQAQTYQKTEEGREGGGEDMRNGHNKEKAVTKLWLSGTDLE